jgi:peptidyl-prolyl cis-trans isomerase C
VASGITLTDDEVEAELDAIRSQFPTDQQYKDALKQAELTEKDLERQMRRQLIVQQHMEAKTKELVLVTDREVRTYYTDNPEQFVTPEQVKASHILIQVSPQASEEDKKKAQDQINEIRNLLLSGADFGETAKERSEGPSGPRGGDLGFFGRGQMVPPFEEAAFALAKGQISQVVETQFGYHIIQVTDRKEAGQLTFEEVKDNVKELLKREKSTEAIDKYIDGLRDQAEIKLHTEEATEA